MCVVGKHLYLWCRDSQLEMQAKRSAESSRQCAGIETCYGHFIYGFARLRTLAGLIYSRLEASVDGSASQRQGLVEGAWRLLGGIVLTFGKWRQKDLGNDEQRDLVEIPARSLAFGL